MCMKWCVCGTIEHTVNTRNCVCVCEGGTVCYVQV